MIDENLRDALATLRDALGHSPEHHLHHDARRIIVTNARDFQIARQLLDRAHVHQRMADEAVDRREEESKPQKTVTVRRLAVVVQNTNALTEADQ